ncbi:MULTISPECIES: hypothetical protein [unclassified Kribbella]|uniref:hypothetical protein n=1 Tax=unclassified Kribbella TaxID=2644121 RepID=UPI0033EB7697
MEISAADLFAFVLRITESWLSAPPALQAAGSEDPLAPERLRQHRVALEATVRSLVEKPA